jgi:hypothetical protein
VLVLVLARKETKNELQAKKLLHLHVGEGLKPSRIARMADPGDHPFWKISLEFASTPASFPGFHPRSDRKIVTFSIKR